MKWGNWKFDAKQLTLTFADPQYEIDLEEITSSSCMLDWIFQVHGKPWVTSTDISDLLDAFKEVLRPQQYFCSSGIEGNPDPAAIAQEFATAQY